MAAIITIPYKPNVITHILPFKTDLDIDVKIGSMSEEMTVGVKDFPRFITAYLQANLALVSTQIGFNVVSERLIINTDPLIVSNMDSMTLGALDIDQNKNYYSI